MSLQTQLVALAQAIGADIKVLKTNDGNLSSLNTTAKNSLVAAINEVLALVGSGGGALISDTTKTTTTTWSSSKIDTSISDAVIALKNSLVNGAGAALDTFKELQDALGNDPTFAATMATALSNRVRFDAAQTLSTAQQLQACTNIGVGDPSTDFVSAYNTAKA